MDDNFDNELPEMQTLNPELDYLTGLYNKNSFIKNIHNIGRRMINGNKPYSLLFCDIDGLKYINDTYNHMTGDIGIKYIAQVINNCIRTKREEADSIIYIDKDPMDDQNLPFRVGGDEFIVILPNCTKEKAVLIKDRIKNMIDANKNLSQGMTLSIGIADTSEIKIATNIRKNKTIARFLNELIKKAEREMKKDKNKDISQMTPEEKRSFVIKHLHRIGEQTGLNVEDPEEIAELIDMLNDYKTKLQEKRTIK